jgi:hypothetical protein
MSEHTKEPWILGTKGMEKGKILAHIDGDLWVIADTNTNLPDAGKADARRIVACVNRCAGIPTDILELADEENVRSWELMTQQRDDYKKRMEDAIDAMNNNTSEELTFKHQAGQFKQQRDDLLAALKSILNYRPNNCPPSGMVPALESIALTAIEKIEGGA